jgi:hypothetical protein
MPRPVGRITFHESTRVVCLVDYCSSQRVESNHLGKPYESSPAPDLAARVTDRSAPASVRPDRYFPTAMAKKGSDSFGQRQRFSSSRRLRECRPFSELFFLVFAGSANRT